MKDYLYTQRHFDEQKHIEEVFSKLFYAFLIFTVSAVTYTIFTINDVIADTKPNVTVISEHHNWVDRGDLIISDDMDSYMHRQGHNQEYLLEDLD